LRSVRRWLAVGTALLGLATLSGCGLGTAGGFTESGTLAGPIEDVERLDGLSISVGSKNFTEQLLLGKIAVILLKSAGADVQDYTNIPGSASSRQAQVEGDVDLGWEYTGTAWIAYLGHTTGIPDKQKQYAAVRDEDKKENGLTWFEPAPMNNTYGFATTQEVAKRFKLSKFSDVRRLPASERTFCVESEFKNRNDGFEPMLKKYGLALGSSVPNRNVKTFDTGAIYAATADGECNFGEIFTTDGRIKALNLKVLADDRRFFPNYSVCPVVRTEVVEEYPQIEELFAPVSKKLTSQTLINLNARIDVDGEKPEDVALDWLKDQGFIA